MDATIQGSRENEQIATRDMLMILCPMTSERSTLTVRKRAKTLWKKTTMTLLIPEHHLNTAPAMLMVM